jgi:hypothetical protein
MHNKCAFTICSKNYLGLALTLEKSIVDFNKDTDFYIFIADEFDDKSFEDLPDNILIAKKVIFLSPELWSEMTFKYDIVEFCTSIKPFCFEYILNLNYKFAVYFDPDILLFDSIDCVYQKLDKYNVIVVPHEINNDTDNPQRGGLYNLGFLALKKSEASSNLLKWWGERLKKNSFSDPIRGFFTDQKWMDHLSVILDSEEYHVSKHLGLNFAPWNFEEREVYKKNNKYFIRSKSKSNSIEFPLVFFHYSAFKYEELNKENYNHKLISMSNRELALYELLKKYGIEIEINRFSYYLSWNYSYNNFDNGMPISLSHRRIYARLINEGINFDNPFCSNGKFFKLLEKNHFLSREISNSERISIKKISNLENKIKAIDFLAKITIKCIGYDKFSLLARFMIRYLHLYNRARLLGESYKNIKIESF